MAIIFPSAGLTQLIGRARIRAPPPASDTTRSTMQLVFTPDLGSSTTLAAAPGTVLQFAARVATRDYNDAVAAGTFVELWG